MNPQLAVSEHHRILLQACCADDDSIESAVATIVDVDAINQADHHGSELLPMLFRRLDSAGIELAESQSLRTAYKRTWHRNQILLHKARPVFEYLESIGIAATLLKGAAMMSSEYHDDMGVRAMGDIDFMVPPRQVEAIVSWMTANGWIVAAGPWDRHEAALAHHAIDLVAEGGGGALDVHHALLVSDRSPDLDAMILANAVPARFGGLEFFVPAPSDQMLHTLAHSKPVGVKHLADALTLVRRNRAAIDWPTLVDRLVQRRSVAPALETIEQLNQVDAWAIPTEVQRALADTPRHWSDYGYAGRPVESRRDAARVFVTSVRQRTRGYDPLSQAKITALMVKRFAWRSEAGSIPAKLKALAVHGTTSGGGGE